jgi:hypothetical protein
LTRYGILGRCLCKKVASITLFRDSGLDTDLLELTLLQALCHWKLRRFPARKFYFFKAYCFL